MRPVSVMEPLSIGFPRYFVCEQNAQRKLSQVYYFFGKRLRLRFIFGATLFHLSHDGFLTDAQEALCFHRYCALYKTVKVVVLL